MFLAHCLQCPVWRVMLGYKICYVTKLQINKKERFDGNRVEHAGAVAWFQFGKWVATTLIQPTFRQQFPVTVQDYFTCENNKSPGMTVSYKTLECALVGWAFGFVSFPSEIWFFRSPNLSNKSNIFDTSLTAHFTADPSKKTSAVELFGKMISFWIER